MRDSPQDGSGVRHRTRRAILGAAASVLARDRGATLAEVASAAGVGRSTLHRYFADREALIEAAIEDSLQALGQSMEDAALDQGPPLEAMRRLVAAMVGVGDRLLFLFGDPRVLEGREGPMPTGRPVIELIERGQAEGRSTPRSTRAGSSTSSGSWSTPRPRRPATGGCPGTASPPP